MIQDFCKSLKSLLKYLRAEWTVDSIVLETDSIRYFFDCCVYSQLIVGRKISSKSHFFKKRGAEKDLSLCGQKFMFFRYNKRQADLFFVRSVLQLSA